MAGSNTSVKQNEYLQTLFRGNMSDTVIAVENLSKKYIISHLADKREQLFSSLLVNKAKSLLHSGKKAVSTPFTNHPSQLTDSQEEFWALNDVSFEIKQGDRVGIIGRNGAGKSTLLKVLSRITEPTKGRITIDGRVASLLEVGTGFHSELSGRENIYLNGAILGMSRVEIKRKFDEIVAFSEVEKFLDTPVKRYSSGMYVRLAFAVAAHLEPEILIVDEVLAVGDAAFQKKCLGKMEDVSAKEGRTVLFVSHNMGAVSRLCNFAIWLNSGQVLEIGKAADVLHSYQSQDTVACSVWLRPEGKDDNEYVTFKKIAASNVRGQNKSVFSSDEPINIAITYEVMKQLDGCQIGVRIINVEGVIIFSTADTDNVRLSDVPRDAGLFMAAFSIPANLLVPGNYSISVAAHMPFRISYEVIEQSISFNLEPSGWIGILDSRQGLVSPCLQWKVDKI